MKQYGETVQLMVTYSCNMRCPKCVQRPYEDKLEKGTMSWQQFLDVVDSLMITPPKKIIISGGEPTLWPYLSQAVSIIKDRLPKTKVEIYSNGIGRGGEDYGIADRISISNYGSINRFDMLRLKRQLGRRMKINSSCQVPVPIEVNGNTLPAICNCYNPSFVGGNVYRCPVVGYNRLGATPSTEYSSAYLVENEKLLFGHEICRGCIANFNARKKYNEEIVFEISGWNTKLCYLIGAGRLSGIFRKTYRLMNSLRR